MLTGGGDCPGLNAVIRAVARRSFSRGSDVVGVREGWRGLVEGKFEPLGPREVSGLLPRGGTVLGTSRSGDKLARALVYGLDIGIDTTQTPFREAVGEPVQVVLDVLGGPALADNLAVLAPRGRLILLGFLAGSGTDADLRPILHKRLEVIGTMMRTRGLEERIPLVREFGARMLPLFETRADQGAALRPVLERTYPMTQLADAHRVLEGNATFGKIVVTW